MEASADEEWKEKLIAYVLEHGDSLEFTKYFWKGCEPIKAEVIQYWKFTKAFALAKDGLGKKEIAEEVGASPSAVYTWLRLLQLPKLAHFLKAYLRMETPPAGSTWLTVECTHGHGIPIGKFVRAPLRITSWEEISDVLEQLHERDVPTAGSSVDYDFGFLLGIMMGDAAKSKSKKGASHRHISLVLSKKYQTNLLIGDFASLCATTVGLRMHRAADLAPADKPNEFYEWISQASPLIDWIYNVALGLRDGELTTYDSVRADWMLLAPRDFRLGLIHGLAESDGSVSIASQTVEFWVDPHRDLLRRILELEGIHGFNSRQAFSIVKNQAILAFQVPLFSPALKTVRYRRHEIMATARRLRKEERLPSDLRERIMALSTQGWSVPDIVEKIVEEKGVLVSFEAAQRWARKALKERKLP